MEQITGTVEKVLYQNEENGYAIVRIKINYSDKKMAKYRDILFTNLLSVTCYFDRVPVTGEEIEFIGEFVEGKYGLQLKANKFNRINVDTLESVIAYLSSDYFPGIGKKIAQKIFETLGNSCLEKIRKDKKELDKIADLTEVQKDTIYETLINNQKREKNTLDFIALGFTMQMTQKIISSLSNNEIEEVKKNPYLLIDKVEGIGFQKADKIAYLMGIEKDDPIRVKFCIRYILNMLTFETGNCFIEKNILYNRLTEYIPIEENKFDEYLQLLTGEGKIIVQDNDVYDYYLYEAEGKLSTLIASRIVHNNEKVSKTKINNALKKIKDLRKIEYSPKQEEAIKRVFEEKIMVITGGPGTGKSTIVRGIIDMYKTIYPKSKISEDVYLLAPTGRAAKRLTEVTGEDAQTIHRFLGYDGKFFHNNERNQISAKMVIIDEMSMVDVILASKLFEALTINTKVIIVGDVDQIPSVSPGDVLKDIIKTEKVPTIRLDKIHRQAQDSTIIRLAHEINNGNIPLDIGDIMPDRSFSYLIKETEIIEKLKKTIHKAEDQKMSLLKDIQVLIPMYRGSLGIDNINKILQEEFNPLNESQEEVIFQKQKFRINDKVIQLVNRSEDGVMNGDIGYVESFKYNGSSIVGMYVMFDSGIVEYNKENYEELKLAYAISIHKSQGSEFFTTIIVFSRSYYMMLKRRLYYTAITRAKKYLIMIGDFDALRIAVNNTEYSRNTKLCDKILKALSSYEENCIKNTN